MSSGKVKRKLRFLFDTECSFVKGLFMSDAHDVPRERDKDWVPKDREVSNCPCKSWLPYGQCCMPYHHGKKKPETAEQLMRSRYSAYFFRLVDYLVETTHPDTRTPTLTRELDDTINDVNWSKLTILNTSKGGKDDKVGKVEFAAEYYLENEPHELHELSRFRRYKGAWKYLDGKS